MFVSDSAESSWLSSLSERGSSPPRCAGSSLSQGSPQHRQSAEGMQARLPLLPGAGAQLPRCGMWDLPRPGIEPVSPALTDEFFTTEPPGKP